MNDNGVASVARVNMGFVCNVSVSGKLVSYS